jgi:hypothetical protein
MSNQQFGEDEKLFRRFPPTHFVDGRVALAGIKSTISYPSKSEDPTRHVYSPSSVRSAYGTAEDARRPQCAEGRQDVAVWGVFSVKVGELPKEFVTQSKKSFDFYPYHAPLDSCPGHTLIHCCESGSLSPHYDDPTPEAKNKLRTTLWQNQFIDLHPLSTNLGK